MSETQIFSILLILSLLCQGFFTMSEMAFVSFNRVRLAYFVEKGQKGALALTKLLEKPTALFGTTLIGLNFFLQLGSECGRGLFFSLGFDPDYAYIPQVIVVLLFAELIPMLAARDHSEHLAMFAIRPIKLLSKLFTPLIYFIDAFSKIVIFFLKSPLKINNSLSRDEIKNLLKDSETSPKESDKEDLEPLIENIFLLKTKTPRDMMTPIEKIPCVSYHSHVGEVRNHLKQVQTKYVPLFHEKRDNIYGIAYAQDLLNLSDGALIKNVARSPWFIVETNTIFQVINQFRKNNQSIAIVLDVNGIVIGILSLSEIVDEIFSGILLHSNELEKKVKVYINRAFPLSMKNCEISEKLKIFLSIEKNATLEELMTKKLGATPKDKEVAYIGDYELIFEGATFPQDRKIRVKSRG